MKSSLFGDAGCEPDRELPQEPEADSWEVLRDGDGGSEVNLLLVHFGEWRLFTVGRRGDGP